jgi:putative PEP-CTERM system TPR-repeat lipoprotein
MLASQAMLQSGSVDNAIELLEKSLTAEPDNESLKLSLARAYLQAQRAEDAIALTKTIADDQGSFYKDLYLAQGYAATNRASEADARIAALSDRFGDNPTVMVLIGDFNAQRNDMEQAGDYYRRAIELDSKNIPARLGLGRIAAASGDTAAAANYFQSVLDDAPDNANALISFAGLKAADGDLEGSERLLLKVLETGDKSPLPRLMLAKIYQQQGDALRVEQSAQEAARLGEGNADVQLSVGDILMSIGEPRAALAYLKKATVLAPESSAASYSLARAQLSLGQPVEARESLDRSLNIEPDGLRASITLALIELGNGNSERALQIANRLQETYPDNPGPVSLAASVHMSQQSFADATELYRKAYSMSPSGASARGAYQAAQSAGLDNAERELELWVAQSPEDHASKLILAQHYTRSGENNKSVAVYEDVIAATDDNPIALNNLAWAYFEMGDDRAESLARRAYELRPDVASIADTLGWILVRKGNLDEGMPMIEEAAAKVPDSPAFRYHLAFAKSESGERAESLEILRKLVRTDVDFSERADAESLLNRMEAE